MTAKIVRRMSSSFALDVEFDAPAGFTMLLGPSGSGKTTILNCLAGLLRPDSGLITLGNRVLFDSSSGVDVPVPGRRVGYLFQTLALFPHMTIEQNVHYGIAKLPADLRRERTTALLESFKIAHLANRKPRDTSGGERQRAALARSLVTDPSMLLLDEPLAALDARIKADIFDDLRRWNASHRIPIIYVTHSSQEAFALGERVVAIESGKVIDRGAANEVLRAPRHETLAQIVGFENVFDATVLSFDERQGTMLCRVGIDGRELEVPLARTRIGASIRIAIRAGDIMVSGERPHAISARNCFEGKIINVRREGVGVILTVDAGVSFEVRVTRGASEELHLQPGRQVWLIVKTYSCNIVEPRKPS